MALVHESLMVWEIILILRNHNSLSNSSKVKLVTVFLFVGLGFNWY